MLIQRQDDDSLIDIEIEVFEKSDLNCISELETEKIQGLCLNLHHKVSLRFLSSFPNLKYLYISGTAKDYDAVSLCPGLELLSLFGLTTDDLSFLSDLSIKQLGLTKIKSKQEALQLPPMPEVEELTLYECAKINNLNDILSMPSLKKLLLYKQKSQEFPDIASLSRLEYIFISECKLLKNIENMGLSESLKTLHLQNIVLKPSDIEAIASIAGLQELRLSEITFKSKVPLTDALEQTGLSTKLINKTS